MVNKCWNCGDESHMNFECPHPKAGGSTKKRVRKEHRSEFPSIQQRNLEVHRAKMQQTKETMASSNITFYFLKPFAEKAVDKLFELRNDYNYLRKNIKISSLRQQQRAADQLETEIRDLSREIRDIYDHYQAVQVMIKMPHYRWMLPNFLDEFILKAVVAEMIDLRKSLLDCIITLGRKLQSDCSAADQLEGLDETFALWNTTAQKDPRSVSNNDLLRATRQIDGIALALKQFQILPANEKRRLKEKILRIRNCISDVIPRREKLMRDIDRVHASSNRGPQELMTFLEKNFPPKRPVKSATGAQRRLFQLSIAYHPDKQVTFHIDWQILASEISKCLNSHLEVYK